MYIQLNSQIICYEKTGAGSPVILLHGNKEDHHIFDPLVEVMNGDHTVYAMDTRGHGESATPKEYHYEDMASDVINLIHALDIEKPHIVGFSDGGIVALLVAMRDSSLISGIICCGANLTPAGFNHRTVRQIKRAYKEDNDPRTLLMLEEPNIDPSQLSRIAVPALIMAGENDCIREKETKRIAAAIPNSEIKIIPNATHDSYVVNNKKLYNEIKFYLR